MAGKLRKNMAGLVPGFSTTGSRKLRTQVAGKHRTRVTDNLRKNMKGLVPGFLAAGNRQD